jgi:polyisoprenoid-binding protein YceI
MIPALRTLLLLLTAGLLGPVSGAASDEFYVQRWVADPAKSQLGFTATQEGAEFTGKFHAFTSSLELQATGNEIALLQLAAVIQLESVDTQYGERDDYLSQEDWFHVDIWPEARYLATSIQQFGDNSYIADGELTLRGVSRPVQVSLELMLEQNGERGKLKGSASLNRLDFGVGQGDWADTTWVGAEVNVKFELYILRAFE